ncbi:MAG: homoserine O-succinyltransferase [Clostridium butyricum]|nr:homoserine O-succinyltransferase [Clostridium butyricum]
MPIKIPKELPAYKVLSSDNIFVMNNERADTQDIRPLKIAILNLMPKKIVTENQLLRYLSNTPLQVEIKLIQTKSYTSHNTPLEHLEKFYSYFDEIKDEKFDGLIITGAPVERMKFEDVAYWDELTQIMKWSNKNVFSTLHICWGAQAGLYYNHNVPKYLLKEKMFGVFQHWANDEKADITRGLSDVFYAPHSRHTEVRREDIEKVLDLEILAESDEAGVFIVATKDRRKVYITGHLEYDRNTLRDEYIRDLEKGDEIAIPKNYFKNDNLDERPVQSWRGSANIVFGNWLNYCVYQNTPYDLNELTELKLQRI